MQKIIVTTGQHAVDIDGLACVIAYSKIDPEQITPVVTGHLNQSIIPEIREWDLNYLTNWSPETGYTPSLQPNGNTSFVIVDVTESKQFPPFVKEDKIIEIYDHHFGYEDKWRRLLGQKAVIEEIGACATLIWEEIKNKKLVCHPEHIRFTQCGLREGSRSDNLLTTGFIGAKPTLNDTNNLKIISPVAAGLLYTAIASNTLNFCDSIATERDKKAFEELKPLSNLPDDWIIHFFLQQQMLVYATPDLSIRRDTKLQNIRGIDYAVGQLELWNSRPFINQYKDVIEANLKRLSLEWLFISPSIGERINYIFTKSTTIKNLLSGVMSISFDGDIGTTDKLWPRKEILKKIQ